MQDRTLSFSTYCLLACIITSISCGCNRNHENAAQEIARKQINAEVHGNSMAPNFLGKHGLVICVNCGFEFPVDCENKPSNNEYICPNCSKGTILSYMDFKPAQKVEIIKSSDTFERWQVIAFKSTKGSHSIKRIVGLPGEKISFSDGDLLVNGKRVRRGIQIQEQMAIPVFDSSYVLLDRISYSGFEDDSVQQHSYQAAYTHFRAYRSNDFEAKRESIVDSYSFNQFLKRDLFPVRDLMVKLDIELQPYLDGWELSIHDGASWLTWRLQYGSLELSFLVDDHRVQVWENVQLVPRFDRHFEIVCSNFDRFAYISFKNQEFLSGPFERSKPIPNPPATCVRFSSPNYLTINKFLLFRDLHYSTENNAAEWKLDNNEYFVVGDNVPVSIDSRHSSFGFVKASQIIGVVRPACSED